MSEGGLGIRPELEHIAACVPFEAHVQVQGYFDRQTHEGYPLPIVRITHDNSQGKQVVLGMQSFLHKTQMGATIRSNMQVSNEDSENVVLKTIDEVSKNAFPILAASPCLCDFIWSAEMFGAHSGARATASEIQIL